MTTENTTFECVIEKLVTGGAGLARHDGKTVFVADTAPGDRVRAEVVLRKKNFSEARLVEVIEAGPGRRADFDATEAAEGGCTLRHLTDEAQREAKREIVLDCFRRLGRRDVSDLLTGPEPAGPSTGYRNKVRLFANSIGHYGTMRPGSHEVIPLERSLLMPDIFNDEILPWFLNLPPVDQIIVRLDGRGGFLILLYGNPGRLRALKHLLRDIPEGEAPLSGCRGIVFNGRPAWGRDFLVIEVAGNSYRVGARSFFQANLHETEAAVDTARRWLDEVGAAGGLLADLYCGVGLFSLALADGFERIIATDTDAHSIRDAQNNFQRGGLGRDVATARRGSALSVLRHDESATAEQWAGSCVVVDPPRRGLGSDVTGELLRLGPRHLLYMSCDPATLSRDAGALCEGGYQLQRLRVFDMFPQTAHLESLALFSRPE